MDDAPVTDAPAALDPTKSDPRELMKALLPAARTGYVKAWELLADSTTPLERRRLARERAKAMADDHAVVAGALRDREARLAGDDLLNARHLAGELERHAEALGKLAEISPHGLLTSQTLRPEALGCGKRYRDPSKAPAPAADQLAAGGRVKRTPGTSGSGRGRGGSDDRAGGGGRRPKRPFEDRGPKVPRDALGTTKHDSQLGDDLDPETRAKLEALRQGLEG